MNKALVKMDRRNMDREVGKHARRKRNVLLLRSGKWDVAAEEMPFNKVM